MRLSDSSHSPNCLAELLPLIGQQMLTGDRVMRAVGHECGAWHVPQGDSCMASIVCSWCAAEATIHLIDGDDAARYTVLLLPNGACRGNARALVDTRGDHAP